MAENAVLDRLYDPRSVEPEIYALWEESEAFRAIPDGSPHERTFTIMIPLPNVTGALHLGHALNNTLQDILTRYHRMRGFNTLWQPGTDHAGIATQAVVERRIRELEGKSRHDLGREELVRRIWQWKDEYEKRIIGQLKLMGCSCDWERTRFTLDEGCARAVRHQFFNLFKDGLIFRGKRLVNWDTELQTAVSNDEVYYEIVKGHFWHFKYPVIDPKPGEPLHVIIATTRPETMLGDTAVAVHPDPEGFFEKQERQLREAIAGASGKDKREFEAKLKSLAARRESHLAQLVQLRDMALDGRKLMLPLVEREIPLIADEWADPTKGSGCVKITPAHDANDYEVGTRHNLAMINVLSADGKVARIVEPDGTTNAHNDEYEGLPFAAEGRDKVVADLDARGLLHAIEDHDVEIGHSDRSKTPIEPYLSDQWFLRTDDVEEPWASARADVPDTVGEPRASARADVPDTVGEPRASARAELRTPDLSSGAILVTWTTYGTWLPGDERGFVSRAPRGDGSHDLCNVPGEPYDADDPQVRSGAMERMEGEPVQLAPEHADVVVASIAGVCERHGIEALAVAIMRDHVHVLCQSDRSGSELLQLLKGNASRELNQKFNLAGSPRWCTKSGSTRSIKAGSDLTAAVEYVQNQKDVLCGWSFDMEGGSSAERFESARAEARGSCGVTLGDGTTAPGLAQAAMDVVNNGRIRIFPQRYTKSYLDWLGERRDWCIGRQLWWGHRIPIWTMEFKPGSARAPDETYQTAAARHERESLEKLKQFFEYCQIANDDEFRTPFEFKDGKWFCYVCGRNPRVDNAMEGLAQILAHVSTPDTSLSERYWEECQQFEEAFGNAALRQIEALRPSVFPKERDPDVLDTWFSSALWPFSTLGWPEETDSLKQYYPGSVLVTSRDIITNWVARMVMFGLYAIGDIPFDHVYVHPKILDARGETMSKSKGNGVDPVDVIHTHGADALRYTMADMTTETQDIRMPVGYVCPHCGKLMDQAIALKAEEQARKSRGEKPGRRLQPADCTRVKCSHKDCGKEFATQWAEGALKEELGVARETSEKFEIGRNFCNKLWNAARFAFMNLEGAPCERLDVAALPPEDRWILAKLSQTIRRSHHFLQSYQFSATVKELREFFWDCLCDWYIELTKPRMAIEPRASARADAGAPKDAQHADSETAKQVLAFCLDQVLRLWHPIIPFVTERLWQQLNEIVPERGLPGIAELGESARAEARGSSALIAARFPPVEGYPALDDEDILATFGELQDATRGVRDLRLQGNVSPKEKMTVTVVVPEEHIEGFRDHSHILRHMANVGELNIVSQGKRPANAGSATVRGLRIFVHDISDDAAERARTEKALAGVERQIAGKEAKLANEKFLANAKPEVVEIERGRLAELTSQRTSLQEHLAELDS